MNDFSGGLTENFLQGDPKRYQKADNFVITVDKKLQSRDGTIPYDLTGYVLSEGMRVAGLFTGINEGYLFGHTGRDFYTQSPDSRYGTAWSRITGPTGNEALGGGGRYSQVTTGEFQRQIYYTSSKGVLPGKLYRDSNNAWKVVTAGMPKMAWTSNYPDDSSLVTRCCVLANAIRASMIGHFNDQANATGVSTSFQHMFTDKWSLGYLSAVSWIGPEPYYPGPQPNPTPAPDATDATSLYALCLALSLAYEHHRLDLAGVNPTTDSGSRLVHQTIYIQPTGNATYSGTSGTQPGLLGLAAKLTTSGIVTTPAKAAAFLDELSTKWYWHQLLPFSHSPDNTYSLMARYLLASSGNDSTRIKTIYTSSSTLHATPNYGDFAAFSYFCKSAMNKHALGTGTGTNNHHSQIDPYGQIPTPDPVDFDSAALTLFWARYLYGNFHVYDSNAPVHNRISFTSTTGSTSINTVVLTSSGGALTLPVDSWILVTADYFDDPLANNKRAARVISSGAGTAVLSRTVTTGAAGTTALYSTSWLHGAYVNGSITTAASDTTAFAAGTAEFLQAYGAIGTDLSTWITLGTEFLLALGAHEANGSTSTVASHKTGAALATDLAGTAAINSNPFFVPTPVTYAWAAFYRNQYVVEPSGLLYVNEGPPVFSNSIVTCPSYPVGTQLAAFNTTYLPTTAIATENPSATLSGIPTLTNTPLTNYDTTVSVVPTTTTPGATGYNQNLNVELYRTTNGGTAFYSLDSIVNGTGSYSDTINENYPRPGTTALNLGKVMYTSGGVVANDPPPQAKFIHQIGNKMYYGAITDTGQYFPQRIRQANASAPDSAPATFFDDLEDELVGLGSARSNLIGICKNSVYRISGSFTSTGQGFMTHEQISERMGGLSAKSIVTTEIGVFFAGTDGFYYTDGFQLIKISLELDKTYRALTASDTQKARIYGCYDKLTRKVWWAMQSSPTSTDNDVFYVFYLDYGVKPSGTFTKAFAGGNSWQPSSHAFFKGRLVIGDSRGYLFKSDPNTKTDPYVTVSFDPTSLRSVGIPWDFKSCALDMGSSGSRKWISKIHTVGQNVGNVALQVTSTNDAGTHPDGSQSAQELSPIQYQKNLMWGDPRVIWGDASVVWKYNGTMDVWRRFPSRSLRSNFKQIEYTPADVVVYKSDDYPEFTACNVNTGTKRVTLTTPTGGFYWPLDIQDYYFSVETDNYSAQVLIGQVDTAFTPDVLPYIDPGNTCPGGTGVKWQIRGVKKNQRLRITSMDVHVAQMGDKFEAYSKATGDGGND